MRSEGSALFLGQSKSVVELNEEIVRVARSDAKVLVTGESGVGKELVAREIHRHGPRAHRPFVPVNCAGLPETLLESELFGHVRGSFTGAYRDKPGQLELADGGTLFLDEVGEMTLRMQGVLLRFLETGEIQKVGAERAGKNVNVRIISATNRSLRDLLAQAQFREDLFYRLNVIHLVVPPLRERKDDIPLLVANCLQRLALRNTNGHVVRSLTPEAMAALVEYSWPGNVRELQNIIERLVVRGRWETAGVEDLPADVLNSQSVPIRPLRERRRTVVDELYERLTRDRESFWIAVYPLYMRREITRESVREVVKRGLEETRGNYRIVTRLFNIPPEDYKRFLNFLRKHECQLPFKEYRERLS